MQDEMSSTDSPDTQQGVAITSGSSYIRPQARKPYDSAVKFEEYHWYAKKTREEEKNFESPKLAWRQILSQKKNINGATEVEHDVHASQLTEKDFHASHRVEISDEEWTNASRAFRTASWGACFYLITTDIMGPFSIGFSMGTLGWGPGIAIFTVIGFLGGYSGYLIWRVFLGVDSFEFPARNYGDLGFRAWGSTARFLTNIMQAISLLLLLGFIAIMYGQNISAISKFKLCYAVCPLLFVIVGSFMTQIRTLKTYGWITSFSVWLNLLVIFITMGVIAKSPPNYAFAILGSAGSAVNINSITPDPLTGAYPPIIHYNNLPSDGLIGSLNGIMSGVLAYAGVQLFVEFMAEMKRPRDFIKAMWGAQLLIYTVYLVYGCFVYYYQGQYSFNPSYQGVSSYGWRTVGNIITLVAAVIAAGLFGNIGVKVFYNNVLLDLFDAPPLITTRGKIIYACIVPVWWIIAYIIAAAIPDFFGFISIISASMLMNMTYTLPPFLALGFDIQRHAIRTENGEGFDPATGEVIRNETTFRRWIRGFMSGGPLQVATNIWHVVYFLASLSLSGLGMYAAIQGMINAFKVDQLTSFSCVSPLNLND